MQRVPQLTGIDPNLTVAPGERIAVNGAFKTPTIRNAELTAPYFHNGSVLTLGVVEFYNRGGNHFNNNIADVDADIKPLGLTDRDRPAGGLHQVHHRRARAL
jgi:hypothetical protein